MLSGTPLHSAPTFGSVATGGGPGDREGKLNKGRQMLDEFRLRRANGTPSPYRRGVAAAAIPSGGEGRAAPTSTAIPAAPGDDCVNDRTAEPFEGVDASTAGSNVVATGSRPPLAPVITAVSSSNSTVELISGKENPPAAIRTAGGSNNVTGSSSIDMSVQPPLPPVGDDNGPEHAVNSHSKGGNVAAASGEVRDGEDSALRAQIETLTERLATADEQLAAKRETEKEKDCRFHEDLNQQQLRLVELEARCQVLEAELRRVNEEGAIIVHRHDHEAQSLQTSIELLRAEKESAIAEHQRAVSEFEVERASRERQHVEGVAKCHTEEVVMRQKIEDLTRMLGEAHETIAAAQVSHSTELQSQALEYKRQMEAQIHAARDAAAITKSDWDRERKELTGDLQRSVRELEVARSIIDRHVAQPSTATNPPPDKVTAERLKNVEDQLEATTVQMKHVKGQLDATLAQLDVERRGRLEDAKRHELEIQQRAGAEEDRIASLRHDHSRAVASAVQDIEAQATERLRILEAKTHDAQVEEDGRRTTFVEETADLQAKLTAADGALREERTAKTELQGDVASLEDEVTGLKSSLSKLREEHDTVCDDVLRVADQLRSAQQWAAEWEHRAETATRSAECITSELKGQLVGLETSLAMATNDSIVAAKQHETLLSQMRSDLVEAGRSSSSFQRRYELCWTSLETLAAAVFSDWGVAFARDAANLFLLSSPPGTAASYFTTTPTVVVASSTKPPVLSVERASSGTPPRLPPSSFFDPHSPPPTKDAATTDGEGCRHDVAADGSAPSTDLVPSPASAEDDDALLSPVRDDDARVAVPAAAAAANATPAHQSPPETGHAPAASHTMPITSMGRSPSASGHEIVRSDYFELLPPTASSFASVLTQAIYDRVRCDARATTDVSQLSVTVAAAEALTRSLLAERNELVATCASRAQSLASLQRALQEISDNHVADRAMFTSRMSDLDILSQQAAEWQQESERWRHLAVARGDELAEVTIMFHQEKEERQMASDRLAELEEITELTQRQLASTEGEINDVRRRQADDTAASELARYTSSGYAQQVDTLQRELDVANAASTILLDAATAGLQIHQEAYLALMCDYVVSGSGLHDSSSDRSVQPVAVSCLLPVLHRTQRALQATTAEQREGELQLHILKGQLADLESLATKLTRHVDNASLREEQWMLEQVEHAEEVFRRALALSEVSQKLDGIVAPVLAVALFRDSTTSRSEAVLAERTNQCEELLEMIKQYETAKRDQDAKRETAQREHDLRVESLVSDAAVAERKALHWAAIAQGVTVENEGLKSQLEGTKGNLAELRRQVDQDQEASKSAAERQGTLQQRLAQLEREKDDAEVKSREALNAMRRQLEERAATAMELEALLHQLNTASTRHQQREAQLSKEMATCASQLEARDAQLQLLQDELLLIRAQRDTLQEAASVDERKATKAAATIRLLEEDLSKERSALESQQKLLEELTVQARMFRGRSQQLDAELQDARQSLQDTTARAEDLQRRLTTATESMQSSTSQDTHLRHTIEQLKRQLEASESEHERYVQTQRDVQSDLQSKLRTAVQALQDKQSEAETLTLRTSQAESRREAASRKVQDLEAEVAAAQRDHAQMLAQQRSEIANEQKERLAVQAQCQKLSGRISELVAEVGAVRIDLSRAETARDEHQLAWKSAVQDGEREVQRIRQLLTQRDASRAQLEASVDQISAALQDEQHQHRATQQRLQDVAADARRAALEETKVSTDALSRALEIERSYLLEARHSRESLLKFVETLREEKAKLTSRLAMLETSQQQQQRGGGGGVNTLVAFAEQTTAAVGLPPQTPLRDVLGFVRDLSEQRQQQPGGRAIPTPSGRTEEDVAAAAPQHPHRESPADGPPVVEASSRQTRRRDSAALPPPPQSPYQQEGDTAVVNTSHQSNVRGVAASSSSTPPLHSAALSQQPQQAATSAMGGTNAAAALLFAASSSSASRRAAASPTTAATPSPQQQQYLALVKKAVDQDLSLLTEFDGALAAHKELTEHVAEVAHHNHSMLVRVIDDLRRRKPSRSAANSTAAAAAHSSSNLRAEAEAMAAYRAHKAIVSHWEQQNITLDKCSRSADAFHRSLAEQRVVLQRYVEDIHRLLPSSSGNQLLHASFPYYSHHGASSSSRHHSPFMASLIGAQRTQGGGPTFLGNGGWHLALDRVRSARTAAHTAINTLLPRVSQQVHQLVNMRDASLTWQRRVVSEMSRPPPPSRSVNIGDAATASYAAATAFPSPQMANTPLAVNLVEAMAVFAFGDEFIQTPVTAHLPALPSPLVTADTIHSPFGTARAATVFSHGNIRYTDSGSHDAVPPTTQGTLPSGGAPLEDSYFLPHPDDAMFAPPPPNRYPRNSSRSGTDAQQQHLMMPPGASPPVVFPQRPWGGNDAEGGVSDEERGAEDDEAYGDEEYGGQPFAAGMEDGRHDNEDGDDADEGRDGRQVRSSTSRQNDRSVSNRRQQRPMYGPSSSSYQERPPQRGPTVGRRRIDEAQSAGGGYEEDEDDLELDVEADEEDVHATRARGGTTRGSTRGGVIHDGGQGHHHLQPPQPQPSQVIATPHAHHHENPADYLKLRRENQRLYRVVRALTDKMDPLATSPSPLAIPSASVNRSSNSGSDAVGSVDLGTGGGRATLSWGRTGSSGSGSVGRPRSAVTRGAATGTMMSASGVIATPASRGVATTTSTTMPHNNAAAHRLGEGDSTAEVGGGGPLPLGTGRRIADGAATQSLADILAAAGEEDTNRPRSRGGGGAPSVNKSTAPPPLAKSAPQPSSSTGTTSAANLDRGRHHPPSTASTRRNVAAGALPVRPPPASPPPPSSDVASSSSSVAARSTEAASGSRGGTGGGGGVSSRRSDDNDKVGGEEEEVGSPPPPLDDEGDDDGEASPPPSE